MSEITLLVEIDVHEGKTDAFKAAVTELVASVEANEPGALRYDFYLSQDGRHDSNVEVFKDSDAVIAHMANVRDLLPILLEAATFTRIEVLGDISAAALETLGEVASSGHQLMARLDR